MPPGRWNDKLQRFLARENADMAVPVVKPETGFQSCGRNTGADARRKHGGGERGPLLFPPREAPLLTYNRIPLL